MARLARDRDPLRGAGPRVSTVRGMIVVGVGVLAIGCVVGARTAAAQLCTWGGTPSLPAPQVVHLATDGAALRAPGRVAIDSQDNLYVADPTRGFVVVKDPLGGIRAVHSGLGVPVAVAVDDLDRVYVGDRVSGRVDRFDPQWQPDGFLGQGDGEFQEVTDIAIDPDLGLGLVVVADGGADMIKVFGPDGQLVRSIGGTGNGAGELDFPSAVWVNAVGEIHVADQNNDRVQIFSREGTFVSCFGAQGGGNRNFGRVLGLVGDDQGRLYVADGFQGHVKVFDSQGAELAVIGGLGDLPGQFRTPFGVAIDGFNRLLVTSVNSGRVDVFGIDDYGVPPSPGLIFQDGFESGDLNAWSATAP
jgi:sugar lactone lactonase YvrE